MPEKNIALIGAGYWGKNLVRNFHQLGVLKTICDQSSAIRQQMAKDYPDTTVTDDFNALLAGNRGTRCGIMSPCFPERF